MITIIVPTYNASGYLQSLLERLESQTFHDYELIVVDSSSEDDTVQIAQSHGANVITIPKKEFDHGGTRTLAAKQAKGNIILYLTQDALPHNEHTVENILKPFSADENVAAAFGRQLPHSQASVFAEHLRLFNYPAVSYTRQLNDRNAYGIKTAFLSNSFAAYRKSALEEVGYFKINLPFGEDTCAGAKMLLKGHKIVYVAEATVLHSHNYTVWHDFKRYFDMGTFHRRENWLLKEFGKAENEGIRYAKSEFSFLLRKKKPYLLPEFMLRTFMKYLGYKLGAGYEQIRPRVAEIKPVIISPLPAEIAKEHRKQFKIAFVCDWLTAMRGGERCLDAMCNIYPDADIFTLVHFRGSVSENIEMHKIRTSYIQRLPCSMNNFRSYLPLFPHAIQKFDLSGYDCILSFSHCVAKSVKPLPHIPHICYCYTPMRYAWHMRHAYLDTLHQPKRLLIECALNRLKRWDRKTSSTVTHFTAISKNVQNRIKQAYDRDSIVIYPPVECDRFAISESDDGYYLVLSALVPYKRIDLAVRAFSAAGQKLLIVGNGPELSRLKNMAAANISFVDKADDNEVAEYLKNCRAVIFPGEEDFGIVPLEAQACGKQVIAFGRGGALETIISADHDQFENATGLFFYEQTPEALQESILLFEKIKDRFDPRKCRDNALGFDRPVYQQAMQNHIQIVLSESRANTPACKR